jgi:methionine synthase II (cobalamin-independent)
MKFHGRCLGTGIGSFPLDDPEEAFSLILENLPEIPFWPQLPKRGFQEQMVPQYAQGFPGIVEDPVKERLHVEADRALSELERFYEKEMAGDVAAFALSPDYAIGFDTMIRGLRRHRPDALVCTKGQVTGPVTFGFSVKDDKGAAIFYDPNLQDVVCKWIALKAWYQIERLKEFGVPTIIFLDEPYMAAFGTTGMNVGRDDVVQAINVVAARIHGAGGLAGVHCCGNTDWSILFETDVDIVNFDAFEFMDRMLLYPEQVRTFLNRGGNLAWGLVPTSSAVLEQSVETLDKRFDDGVEALVRSGIDGDTIFSQSLVTPACGLGSLSGKEALSALSLVRQLSRHLRNKHL